MKYEFYLPHHTLLKCRATKKPSNYSTPQELCSFSFDKHGKFSQDSSQLKILSIPDDFYSFADLLVGFQDHQPSEDKPVAASLEYLLRAAKHSQINTSNYDFITWRGELTRMFCTLFIIQESWEMIGNVVVSGQEKSPNQSAPTIFLMGNRQPESQSSQQREFIYGGRKFEVLCMVPTLQVNHKMHNNDELSQSISATDIPMSERQKAPIHLLEEYDILFEANLGSHRLLLGAEVDGIDTLPSKDLTPNYIELKTINSKAIESRSFNTTKSLKWWLQSYLAGISTILVGCRNDAMSIESLKRWSVAEIPQRVAAKDFVGWSPDLVLAWGEWLLNWIRNVVTKHQSKVPIPFFTLSYNPKSRPHVIVLEFGAGHVFLNEHPP